MSEKIELRGVRTHNLKNIDVDFPLEQISVVTGVSGSGKSSLVFDTLYAESYGRYTESLSSFARQYMKSLPRPAIGGVKNLPPAIAVEQRSGGGHHRSTVGTMTELADFFRIVFGYFGKVECHKCGTEVAPSNPVSVADWVKISGKSKKVMILASLAPWKKMTLSRLKNELSVQGFVRLLVGGDVKRIEELKAKQISESYLIIDRVTVRDEDRDRLISALDLGFKAGRGLLSLYFDGAHNLFSNRYDCLSCGEVYLKPSPTLFNHNHPSGACPLCQGFGSNAVVDLGKVVPDGNESLASKGVKCWNFGRHANYYRQAEKSAKEVGVSLKKPFKEYTDSEWRWLMEGAVGTGFTGVAGYFAYLDRKKYKAHYRIHAARFKTYEVCQACDGSRLRKESRAVKVEGVSLQEMGEQPIVALSEFIQKVVSKKELVSTAERSVLEALSDADTRIDYLLRVGLGYLPMNRSCRSLSGGELQRIQMARSLGSGLTGTLYCLDEPSSGLHARDCDRLFDVIEDICNQGNTVVMVEHEASLIRRAPNTFVIGPGAGSKGGQLVEPKEFEAAVVDWGGASNASFKSFMKISKVKVHNLKNIDVCFPHGGLSVVCGVSGSGKSSLVRYSLLPALEAYFSGRNAHSTITGVPKRAKEVIFVGQEGLTKSSRSNIATYLDVFSEVRKLFSELPKAQGLGLNPGAFSFNVAGGRCETCKGMGEIVEDLSFLGDVKVICQDCEGRRFSEAVLSVEFRGKNLTDILALTVADALEFFFDQPKIVGILTEVVNIGLGYMTLGQPTGSFSGGEAQRLKLLSIYKRKPGDGEAVLLLDEPTTGLSDHDVSLLVAQLRSLVAKGHTVVVVEHHLGVISSSDWLVEIGPEAGQKGGSLVYSGYPAGIMDVHESRTAPFLSTLKVKK